MDMITVKQAAENWGVTPRRVQGLCKEGKIKGAVRWERTWMIPYDAEYPKGKKFASEQTDSQVLPRSSPSLIMSDLYHTPGTADSVAATLSDNEQALAIFSAELAYNRFEFDLVSQYAKVLLHDHNEFHTTIAGGFQLSLCAAYKGDLKLLREARKHIFETPCKTDIDRDMVNFWICIVDFMLGETNLPEWFQKGQFDFVPAESYPIVKYQYAKFQWMSVRKMIFSKDSEEKARGKILLAAMPNLLEPMISQAIFDRTLCTEIALRLVAAIVYHDLHKDEDAIYHIDKAISLAAPDRLFTVFVESRYMLDTLLDERLAAYSPEILKTIKAYSKQMEAAQLKLHNELSEYKRYNLSVREREAAKLAAFGMSNEAIGKRMHISESSVRSLLSMAMNKTGAENRKALGMHL